MRPLLSKSWICCLACVGLAAPGVDASEPQADPRVLASQLVQCVDPSLSRDAFLAVRRQLRTGDDATVHALQESLCDTLRFSENPMAIRRICLGMSAAPTDEAVALVVDRLSEESETEAQIHLCMSLRHLVSEYLPVSDAAAATALSQLQRIVRTSRVRASAVNAAVLAIAGFGPRGYDQLIALRDDPGTREKVANTFYTALAETGDPRALSVLRKAIQDEAATEGALGQAIHAAGNLFVVVRRRNLVFDPSELAEITTLVRSRISQNTSDQLFSVALRALAKMEDVQQDSELYAATVAAAESESAVRRTAAFEVLYLSDMVLQKPLLAVVKRAAESDEDVSARSIAQALVAKDEVMRMQAPE